MSKKNLLQILILLLVTVAIIVSVVLTGRNGKSLNKDGYYFDTYVNLTVYSSKDSKYLDECLKMCERYDALFSPTIEGSDVYNINHAAGESVKVDPETYYLLQRAIEFCEETDGAVDITIAPLMDTWGLSHESGILSEAGITEKKSKPTDSKIQDALKNVDYRNVILEDDYTVRLKNPETRIDLGFIAKGYIADKLKEYLVSKDVKSAIISLGGNVVVIGTKPDGSDYNIGIKDPDNSGEIIESLKANNSSVVTSGTYERYVEYDGIKYHHILDTATGYPVDNGIKSVTILSDSSLEGDALSTVCLILGEEGSKDILTKYNAEAVFH